jgi:hypothetical protein
MFEYDAFISYSSKDKSTVHTLAQRLKNDGVRVWLDKWAIKPGDSIPIQIQIGLKKSRTVLMFMSPAYFDSEWGWMEHITQLFRDPTNRNRRLIPIMITDCEPPDIIAHLSYIDWRTYSAEEYQRLVDSCLEGKELLRQFDAQTEGKKSGKSENRSEIYRDKTEKKKDFYEKVKDAFEEPEKSENRSEIYKDKTEKRKGFYEKVKDAFEN